MTKIKRPSDLACAIARGIFKVGDNPSDKTQRIAFKGGDYNDEETDLGGFCEESLAQQIDKSLKDEIFKNTASQGGRADD